ncbi:MAG TPA: hypothetical protein VHG29_10915 [Novosphingobium sp.]|nr:hypothetical protein [Novosphingobium sp.]
MRRCFFALLAGVSLCSAPAFARAQDRPAEVKSVEPAKPVTDREVTATDVVATPLDDLNLRKEDLPALLIAAQDRPYDLTGLRRCPQIAAAVGELDAVLGHDIDMPQGNQTDMSAGRVAREAVASFIPFRGLIRELSGANGQERKLQVAIYAGTARRSFLKGVGEARGCNYPARSATPAMMAAREAVETTPPVKQSRRRGRNEATYVARPVVQKVE